MNILTAVGNLIAELTVGKGSPSSLVLSVGERGRRERERRGRERKREGGGERERYDIMQKVSFHHHTIGV